MPISWEAGHPDVFAVQHEKNQTKSRQDPLAKVKIISRPCACQIAILDLFLCSECHYEVFFANIPADDIELAMQIL